MALVVLDKTNSNWNAGVVGYAVGGTLLAGAVVMYLLWPEPKKEGAWLTPSVEYAQRRVAAAISGAILAGAWKGAEQDPLARRLMARPKARPGLPRQQRMKGPAVGLNGTGGAGEILRTEHRRSGPAAAVCQRTAHVVGGERPNTGGLATPTLRGRQFTLSVVAHIFLWATLWAT